MGLIPARAGNTGRSVGHTGYRRAHPRSRGEHSLDGVPVNGYSGSSPLARGTPDSRTHHGRAAGLIPARAGNTDQWKISEIHGGAHPRSRGEHGGGKNRTVILKGSSPLARGTLGHALDSRYSVGLIPARAGNTTVFDVYSQNDRAHPRSRGEHPRTGFAVAFRAGSSPLARGTPKTAFSCTQAGGLIPARAGNTQKCIS